MKFQQTLVQLLEYEQVNRLNQNSYFFISRHKLTIVSVREIERALLLIKSCWTRSIHVLQIRLFVLIYLAHKRFPINLVLRSRGIVSPIMNLNLVQSVCVRERPGREIDRWSTVIQYDGQISLVVLDFTIHLKKH